VEPALFRLVQAGRVWCAIPPPAACRRCLFARLPVSAPPFRFLSRFSSARRLLADYTNNLGDFMAENDLQSLTQISSVGDLNAAAESIESKFCTPEA
jgi:hypothetical protein